MTGRTLCRSDRNTPAPDADATPDAASSSRSSAEPTLDQLFAEPIVRQLMRRDRTDEPTIRHLLRETAVARAAAPTANGPAKTQDRYTIVRLLHETARAWRCRYDREVRAELPE